MITTTIMDGLFSKLSESFISLKQVVRQFAGGPLKSLGLKATAKQNDIAAALGELPAGYGYLKKGAVQYLIKGNPEDLVLNKVKNRPGRTFGELARALPIKKEMLREMVNRMLETEVLSARISPTEKVQLHPGRGLGVAPGREKAEKTPIPASLQERVMLFKKAHDQTARGDYYVHIYKIRRLLGWSRDVFDELMDHLMVEGYVLANPGNPAQLTDDQVQDCFQDDFGDLYITVNWRGRP
jgi:hypothetical protein